MRSHEHDHSYDKSVLNRIRGISVLNGAIGTVEFTAGLLTNSSTLTMAGVHDMSDSALYSIKYKAAETQHPHLKRRLRRLGAASLMGAAVAIGGYEIAHSQFTEEPPHALASGIGIVAAGANIIATTALHSKRHHTDAHDSWKHVVGVDLPGSLITLVVVPLSIKYPELDTAGALAHMGLAIGVGSVTLREINREFLNIDDA